eukprot:COSAG05_NODE_21680_length_270_cov_0.602339_1_plen_35_part_01
MHSLTSPCNNERFYTDILSIKLYDRIVCLMGRVQV